MSATESSYVSVGYGYAAAPLSASTLPALTLTAHIEDFNKILKRLTREIAVKFPTDAMVDRAKKRILIAIDLNPTSIIDTVGPYLYAYQSRVYAGDEKFFIENDYNAELRKTVDAEKIDLASYLIQKTKEAWRASAASEKETYKQVVQSLLDVYIDYLALKLEQQ